MLCHSRGCSCYTSLVATVCTGLWYVTMPIATIMEEKNTPLVTFVAWPHRPTILFLLPLLIQIQDHWQMQSTSQGHPRLVLVQILSFSCSFREICYQMISWRSHLWGCPCLSNPGWEPFQNDIVDDVKRHCHLNSLTGIHTAQSWRNNMSLSLSYRVNFCGSNVIEAMSWGRVVNFICETKSVSKQDVLIMVTWPNKLYNEPKPCFPSWLLFPVFME